MKLCGFINVAFFVLLIYLIFCCTYSGIKLPLAPVNYCAENNKTETCEPLIQMSVNSLKSDGSAIQYDYNYFDFCQVKSNDIESEMETFGRSITGETASPYYFVYLKNETKEVCRKIYSNSEADKIKIEKLQKAIRENYKHHWIVDRMPITWCYIGDGMQEHCDPGFPIGCYINDDGKGRDGCNVLISNPERNTYYIFNHIEIVLGFHTMRSNSNWGSEVPNQAGRLVKARLLPKSVKYTEDQIERAIKGLNPIIPVSMKVEEGANIIYSFSVYFTKNTQLQWSSRWDYILESYPNTSWFSPLISFAIFMLFFCMVVILILINLRRDIHHYNQIENSEEGEEERGWKLISGEVFRPPMHRMLLSVLLGNGVYIFLIVLITLYFAWLGYFSPENTSLPEIYALVLVPYLCLSAFGGYVSSRIYKMVDGQKWKTKTLVISLLCPWIVLGVFVTMKQCVMGLSYPIPFSTLATILSVCLTISVALNFLGMYFGFKTSTVVHPVGTEHNPRPIPIQRPFYTKTLLGIVIGGMVPFGCTVMNLAAIFNRIWSHQLYSVVGTLFIMFVVLVLSCSLITILFCYLHLRNEDYRWWWRSFLTSGLSAVYFFLYSVYYYVSALKSSGFVNALLYFGYTTIITVLLFLFTGTIGFFACFWFIRKIYSAVRMDKQRIWNIQEDMPKDESAVRSNTLYHKLSEVFQSAFTYVSKRAQSEKPANQPEYKLLSSFEDNDSDVSSFCDLTT